jgi:hypothetical protein
MNRIAAVIALAALAVAVGLTQPRGAPDAALAQGSGSGAGVKTCKAKLADGKAKTWRCQRDQACCVNKTMGTVSCGIPGMGCL